MKKITITLGSNESKFTTMVDDEFAKKVFGETVMSLINCQNKSKEVTAEDLFEEKPIKRNSINEDILRDELIGSAVNKNILRGIMNKVEKPKSTPWEPHKDTRVEYNTRTAIDLEKKHLCFYECKDCGKSFFKMACFGEEISCACGAKEKIEHFSQGIYECSCCNFKGFFKIVNGSEISEVKCKGCESPIDMKYNTDKKQWLSINKFR